MGCARQRQTGPIERRHEGTLAGANRTADKASRRGSKRTYAILKGDEELVVRRDGLFLQAQESQQQGRTNRHDVESASSWHTELGSLPNLCRRPACLYRRTRAASLRSMKEQGSQRTQAPFQARLHNARKDAGSARTRRVQAFAERMDGDVRHQFAQIVDAPRIALAVADLCAGQIHKRNETSVKPRGWSLQRAARAHPCGTWTGRADPTQCSCAQRSTQSRGEKH